MIEQNALAAIGLLSVKIDEMQGLLDPDWEKRIQDRWDELHQQRDDKADEINRLFWEGAAKEAANILANKAIPLRSDFLKAEKFLTDENYGEKEVLLDEAIEVIKDTIENFTGSGVIQAAEISYAGFEAASTASKKPVRMYEEVAGAYNAFEYLVDAGVRLPTRLAVDPATTHVVMEDAYSQTWVDSGDEYIGPYQPMGTPHYADIRLLRETLGLMPDATIRTLREDYPELPYEASESYSEWILRNKAIVDAGKNTWEEVLINQALSPGHTFADVGGSRMFRDDFIDLDQNDFLYRPLAGRAHFSHRLPDDVGDVAPRLQDAAAATDDASFALGELVPPLLRTRDGALGLAEAMGSGYGGDGVTGAMDHAGFAADGLALSTGAAEQALLAAGLTGDSTTQVLDLMRRAGLDPTTSAWGELAAAVHVWGDATDIEVDRVIGRLGELARVQGGGGPGSAGSSGSSGSGDSGGGAAQAALGQLMSLAYRVAEERARMGGKPQDFVDHELGKVLGQLGAPDSVAEKLALLRLFFAGSAHGLSFGLGPSATSLGFDIPQFAGGGTVPGPLGAPQLIVAHGGEHIVPHRATGSPTIIRIELDREVLSQAVLGDLLRLQGREVTLGLS